MIYILDHADGEQCFYDSETQVIYKPKLFNRIDNFSDVFFFNEKETAILPVYVYDIAKKGKSIFAILSTSKGEFKQKIKGWEKDGEKFRKIDIGISKGKCYLLFVKRNDNYASGIEILRVKELKKNQN